MARSDGGAALTASTIDFSTHSPGCPLDFRSVAEARPDVPALIDRGFVTSYRALADRVKAVVSQLKRAGFHARTPLAWNAALDVEALVEALAALQCGVPLVPLDPRHPPAEQHRRKALAGAAKLDETPKESLREDDVLAVLFTSGSTGTPKGVVLTRGGAHAALSASARRIGWEAHERWALTLPPSHIGGLSVVLRTLSAGRTLVLGEGSASLPTLLEMHRVSIVSLVPTQLRWLVNTGRRAPTSLRVVLVGGAALAPSLRAEASALGYPIWTTYGMTETCAQAATARPGDGACGQLLHGFEGRIVDGVLELKGPAMFRRYLDEAPIEGFFRTGDLARFDDDGSLHILGRADERIISGGENVDPLAVEAALAKAGFTQCIAFGIPDATWGQRVAIAFEGELPDLNALRSASEILPTYARPRVAVRVPSFPRTASGKVQRRALAAGEGKPVELFGGSA